MRQANLSRSFPLLLLFAGGCSASGECEPAVSEDDVVERKVGGLTFVRRVVDNAVCGPAYVQSGDLDGDGVTDLVVSALGPAPNGKVPPGTVTAYLRRGDAFEARSIVSADEGIRFPNRSTLADLDDDGDLDILLPLGFFPCSFELFGEPCGGLLRFDNDGTGRLTRRDIQSPGSPAFHHGIELADLDGDGLDDLVTVDERRDAPWDAGTAALQWYRGKGGGEFSGAASLGEGLSTFPSVGDVDGDGDLDVAGAEFLGSARASFAWMENRGVDAAFQRHVISDDFGPGFGLTLVPDLIGDGRLAAVGTNHTNPTRRPDDPPPSVVLFVPGEDATAPWEQRVLLDGFSPEDRSGQFSPGLFGVGDLDGDSRLDIVVSGDGDDRVFLLLQTAPGSFSSEILETGLGQAGGMLIEDLDGDGQNELVVTGYEDHIVFLYQRQP